MANRVIWRDIPLVEYPAILHSHPLNNNIFIINYLFLFLSLVYNNDQWSLGFVADSNTIGTNDYQLMFQERLNKLRNEVSEKYISDRQTSSAQEMKLQRYISTLLHDLHVSYQSKLSLQEQLLEQCK